MTRMTGPDCAVMCNLTYIYIHTYIHTVTATQTSPTIYCREGKAAEEGTAAATIRSAVANRVRTNITRGRANVRGAIVGSPGDANWKAPGADSLPVELLKLDDPTREPVVLRHFHAILVHVLKRGGNHTGVERRNDQGAPQEVGPFRLQQLPRDLTHPPRRQSTAEDRRQSP